MAVDALPGALEAGEGALVGGLDLGPQRGQRRPPQPPQDLGVAPLARRPARPQLAAHQVPGLLQPLQHRRQVEPVARRAARPSRTARACGRSAARAAPSRPGTSAMNASGSPDGGTAPSASRYSPASSAATQRFSPPTRSSIARRSPRSCSQPLRRAAAQLRLVQRQVADAAQHVVQRVHGVRARALRQPLQVGLDRLQRARVDQLAQLLLPEQLAQQLAVQRQRRRAALGVGLVALVHVGRDVVEQQRGRERRGGLRLDLDQRELAPVQLGQQVVQAGQVQHVAQDLAVGLEHDRELRVAARDLQQRLRLQPLLPQRRAPARDRRAGSAARGRRSRGSARRTARSRPARRRRGPRARPGRSSPAPRRAPRRRRGGGR